MDKEVGDRVLLISDAGRVLLVGSRNPDPDRPTIWVAPGGTAELEETPRNAATRELLEETGIAVTEADLIGPVGVTEGPNRYEEYFLLPLEDGYLPAVENPDIAEASVWIGFRWWSGAELETATDIVWPVELSSVLRERDALRSQALPRVFHWDTGES